MDDRQKTLERVKELQKLVRDIFTVGYVMGLYSGMYPNITQSFVEDLEVANDVVKEANLAHSIVMKHLVDNDEEPVTALRKAIAEWDDLLSKPFTGEK